MSKPTLQERAAAFDRTTLPFSPTTPASTARLMAFAAREVARVRKLQRGPLAYMNARYLCVPDAQKALRDMKAATRPERPARAKARSVKIGKLSCGPKCRRDPLTRFEAFTPEAKAAYPVEPKFIERHDVGCKAALAKAAKKAKR